MSKYDLTLERWGWLLHDIADNMERAAIHEAEDTVMYSKLCQWAEILGDIKFEIKDQMTIYE